MNAVRDWALAVCTAAVAGSLVHLVAPGGGTQKVLRMTVSVFFLCAIFAPVLSGAFHGGFELPEAPEAPPQNTEAVEEQMHAQAELAFSIEVQRLCGQVLEEIGIMPEKIAATVHTGEDGDISITELVITLRPEDQSKQAEVQKQVKEKLGLEPVLEVPTGGT